MLEDVRFGGGGSRDVTWSKVGKGRVEACRKNERCEKRGKENIRERSKKGATWIKESIECKRECPLSI